MKNDNLFGKVGVIVFTVSLFFIACLKQNDTITAPAPMAQNKSIDGHAERLAILQLPPASQRIVFEQKSGNVKVAIWNDKLDQVVQTPGWSADQLAKLGEIRAQLNTELWTSGSQAEADFVNRFHDSWVASAKQIFDEDQLGYIIATLDDYVPTGPVGNPNVDDCNCSFSSDWCPGSSTCQAARCGSTTHGCGTFWTYKCLGECNY